MGFRSVTLLGIALIVSMSFAQGQQQQQAPVSSAAGQEQSEISTVGTDAAIKVRVNLVLVRVVVRDGAGKVVPVNALALATNLEKFTAQEHIDYVMLDRAGMVEEYDSGTFQYVYSIEQQGGKSISREYRTPIKGSHEFRAAGQEVGGGAIALMFLPDLRGDYEMKCEGMDERSGQHDWVVHFEQRTDRPSRTAKVWANGAASPGILKGRAWISKGDFQVVHMEAGLMTGLPDVGLQKMAFSVDYALVQNSAGDLKFWLPVTINTYWDFDPHRTILTHKLSEFELFAVDTKESVQGAKQP